MTITREQAEAILHTYIKAWQSQDVSLILSIFTPDAIYHERPLEAPIIGHEGIRRYWQQKVVDSQRRISCRLLNVYVDDDTVIAEWEAEFDDLPQGVRKMIREVAIVEMTVVPCHGHRIASLREYWTSAELGSIAGPGLGHTRAALDLSSERPEA